MTNAITTPTETAKQKCQLCNGIGTNGARWLVTTNQGDSVRVHKPCGEKLVESAPANLEARLVPSSELKAEWTAKRTQRQAQDFWASKCPQLAELKQQLEQEENKMG